MPEEYRRQEDRDKLIQLNEAVTHMNKSMEEVKSTLADIRASLGGVQVMQSEVNELKSQNAKFQDKLQDHEVRFGQYKVIGSILAAVLVASTGLVGWGWTQLSTLTNNDSELNRKVTVLELKQDNMSTLINLKSQADNPK